MRVAMPVSQGRLESPPLDPQTLAFNYLEGEIGDGANACDH